MLSLSGFELYSRRVPLTDVHAENNYRKLEIGFLASVPVLFNAQSYIKIEKFIKTLPAQKIPRLRGDWSLDYLTLQLYAIKMHYLP